MRYLTLALVTAVAGLAGCGGSESEDGDARPPAPSGGDSQAAKDSFVRRIDALCKEVNPSLKKIRTDLLRTRNAARAGRADPNTTFRTFARLLRKTEGVTNRTESELRAIKPPRSEEGFHKDLLRSLTEGRSNLRQQVRAAEARDAVRLRELSVEGTVISSRQKGLITGHGGFRHCTSG